MKLKLWGTRGSIPSPITSEIITEKIIQALLQAEGINLSDPTEVHAYVETLPFPIRGTAGGDTPCVEVRSGKNLIILDAGSGLRRLGIELMKEEFGQGKGVAHIFISHTHWDHIQGFPFFRPAFVRGNRLYIYGVHDDLEGRFRGQQNPVWFPVGLDYMQAEIHFVSLQEGETVSLGNTRIRNIRLNHPGDSYGYRIEDDEACIVYATDNEYKRMDQAGTQHFVEFFRDADVLIFDAMFTLRESLIKEDWGHSNAIIGVDIATMANVRRLLLFHHDPTYTDEEIWTILRDAQNYQAKDYSRSPCEIMVAYDGLELDLYREARLTIERRREGPFTILTLAGRLNAQRAPQLEQVLQEVSTQEPSRVILDLGEVVHLDAAGLQAILDSCQYLEALALANPSWDVRRALRQMDGEGILALYETVDEAKEALRHRIPLVPGQTLDERYEVQALISRDLWGTTYKAMDRHLNRLVTLKVLAPSWGERAIKHFLAAAEASRSLRHPHIATLYEMGRAEELHYLVMEYTPGRTLRELLEDHRPLPVRQAFQIALEITSALEHAHQRGALHRGLAPETILIQEDGRVRLLDFGLNRPLTDRPLNKVPAYVGSPVYLSPEQLQGRNVGPASDLYALGTVLYEMLTGHSPFPGPSSEEALLTAKLHQAPPDPRRRRPDLAAPLAHVVLRLMARDPDARYPSAASLRRVLEGLLSVGPMLPLLGREAEIARLLERVQDTLLGGGGLVLITGEPGIGKTRLLQEMIARVQGYTILTGREVEPGSLFPYRPFISAIRHHLRRNPGDTSLLSDFLASSPELPRLIPEAQAAPRPPVSEGDTPGHPTPGQQRLFEGVKRFLEQLAERQPVLFILEDLEAASPSTLALLEYLVRANLARVLFCVTYQDDLGEDRPLQEWLNRVTGLPGVDLIRLSRLGPVAVHQMTLEITGPGQVPPDFALWLYGETEGNPLYIEEMVRAYLQRPQGRNRRQVESLTPATLDELILHRLEPLSEEALDLLRHAAVLGFEFEMNLLIAATGRKEEEVLLGLDEVLDLQVLRVSEEELNGGTRVVLRFTHPLVRQVLYAEMLSIVRARLHRHVGHALERKPANVLEQVIPDLAHHFVQAGEHDKALNYLLWSGRKARALYADVEALHYYDQALTVLEALERSPTLALGDRRHRQNQRKSLLAAREELLQAIADRENAYPSAP
ncbi:MAG: STAS domain-containing protein, partial [Chloroflexi bacterium]